MRDFLCTNDDRFLGGIILARSPYVMKHSVIKRTVFVFRVAILLCLIILSVSVIAQEKKDSQIEISAKDKETIKIFQNHTKEYVKAREEVRKKLPKLSKESTPEQIKAHDAAFEDGVRKARAGAKPGDVFSRDIANYIRTLIKAEFKGKDRAELRETVLEADTKGVSLRVNYPYPETKELTQIPPTLLLKLPQLPKEVKYRFVGRHLLLVDTDNGLIVDYMLNALP